VADRVGRAASSEVAALEIADDARAGGG